MSEVEELEARIVNLSREDLARLRDWFLQLDDQLWDEQIASDVKARKFQKLIEKARQDSRTSRRANFDTRHLVSLVNDCIC